MYCAYSWQDGVHTISRTMEGEGVVSLNYGNAWNDLPEYELWLSQNDEPHVPIESAVIVERNGEQISSCAVMLDEADGNQRYLAGRVQQGSIRGRLWV